jgi:hypothetical protein
VEKGSFWTGGRNAGFRRVICRYRLRQELPSPCGRVVQALFQDAGRARIVVHAQQVLGGVRKGYSLRQD